MPCPGFAGLFRMYFFYFSSSSFSLCLSYAPSRPLSKNALSFFLRIVILQSLPPSSSSLPSSSSSQASSVRAHSICGMAASAAFSRNASLSSIFEAATWRSSSVFTSFYIRDVQFSSFNGFCVSLGPVVAAGNVL